MRIVKSAPCLAILLVLVLSSRPATADIWVVFNSSGSVNGVPNTTDYEDEGDILLGTNLISTYNQYSTTQSFTVASKFEDWMFEEVDAKTTTYTTYPQEYDFFTHTHQISATDGTEHYQWVQADAASGNTLAIDNIDFAKL